jgi:hypothetical protein
MTVPYESDGRPHSPFGARPAGGAGDARALGGRYAELFDLQAASYR